MNGYAVTARIERAPVRPAGGLEPASPEAAVPPVDTPGAPPTGARRTVEDVLADLRTAWDQTTFYLFDPESWR